MFNDVQSYLRFGSNFTSMEWYDYAGKTELHLVKAKRKKGKFEQIETFSLNSPEELGAKLKKDHPVFLIINSDQVILKKVESKDDETSLLQKAFPTIDLDKFYYQVYKATSHSFVALIRKSALENSVASIQKAGISVIGVSLAFFSIRPLLPYLSYPKISASNFDLIKEENEISACSISEEQLEAFYTIEDVQVSSTHLLALSGLFHFGRTYSASTGLDQKNNVLQKDYDAKQLFKKGLAGAIAVLFVLLLINFLFFDFYFSQVQELEQTAAINKDNLDLIRTKNEIVKEKTEIVNFITGQNASRSGYYFNRIVANLPASISLNEMSYQPLIKPIREAKLISLKPDEIVLSGIAKDRSEFLLWKNYLENLAFVDQLVVTSFTESSRTRSFSLVLTITSHDAEE